MQISLHKQSFKITKLCSHKVHSTDAYLQIGSLLCTLCGERRDFLQVSGSLVAKAIPRLRSRGY
jgi:hypothetical protein